MQTKTFKVNLHKINALVKQAKGLLSAIQEHPHFQDMHFDIDDEQSPSPETGIRRIDTSTWWLCPFCGGTPDAHYPPSDSTSGFYSVTCSSCRLRVGGFRSEKDARDFWNRRSDFC